MSKIDEAFKAVPRISFLRPEYKDQHELDVPLPIGSGQTNSQPSTVRQMLLWLDPQPGDKILDVGSGSGGQPPFWRTSLVRPARYMPSRGYLNWSNSAKKIAGGWGFIMCSSSKLKKSMGYPNLFPSTEFWSAPRPLNYRRNSSDS
jgi:hypothetical protein